MQIFNTLITPQNEAHNSHFCQKGKGKSKCTFFSGFPLLRVNKVATFFPEGKKDEHLTISPM